METFRTLDSKFERVPAAVVGLLTEIDRSQGREEAFKKQHPQALETLVQISRVQSTEASNAIENIRAPYERIQKLVAEKTTPANRAEEEIAGYRYVLDLIHSSAEHISFSWNVVLQFHRDLYRYTGERNVGMTKISDNVVTDTLPDGTEVVRFKPVAAGEAERAMQELHERFAKAWAEGRYHRLLLIASYIFDFTVIHPFQDGNGRMSRLLTLLLLYHAGYDVGRYVSLERLIAETKGTYYDALEASTRSWNEGAHDIYPWISYFLGVELAACKEFEEQVGAMQRVRGSKTAAVQQLIRSAISDEFTLGDIRQACPSVSDAQIRKVLDRLKKRGAVRLIRAGRYARYKRLTTEF